MNLTKKEQSLLKDLQNEGKNLRREVPQGRGSRL